MKYKFLKINTEFGRRYSYFCNRCGLQQIRLYVCYVQLMYLLAKYYSY